MERVSPMQLGKEYPTTERDSALYALLTCTRSFEPVRLRKHHILPASEFEDCSSEEIAMRKRMRHCSNVDGRVCRRSTLCFSASNWGQYGLCEDCGDEISLERLQVDPLRRVVLIAITNAYAASPSHKCDSDSLPSQSA
jgi:hypothetical protein